MTRLPAILILAVAVTAAPARAQRPAQGPPADRDRPAPVHDAPAHDQQHDEADPDKHRHPVHDRLRGRDRFRLSDQEAEQALRVIGRLKPELGEELTRLREDEPRRFARELEGRFPRVRWLLRLKRFDPEMFELRMRDMELYRSSRDLAERVRAAREAGRSEAEAAAREKLDDVVARHFEVRQQIREAELARLERRLAELREQIADRARNRQRLIAEHTESLIHDEHRPGKGPPHDGDGDRDRNRDHEHEKDDERDPAPERDREDG